MSLDWSPDKEVTRDELIEAAKGCGLAVSSPYPDDPEPYCSHIDLRLPGSGRVRCCWIEDEALYPVGWDMESRHPYNDKILRRLCKALDITVFSENGHECDEKGCYTPDQRDKPERYHEF